MLVGEPTGRRQKNNDPSLIAPIAAVGQSHQNHKKMEET
jgi:hypothetical protein